MERSRGGVEGAKGGGKIAEREEGGRWEEDRLYGAEGGRDEEDGGDVGGEGY